MALPRVVLPAASSSLAPSCAALSSLSPFLSLPLEPAGRAFTLALIGPPPPSSSSSSDSSASSASASSSPKPSASPLRPSPSSESINFSDSKWEALRQADIDPSDYYSLLGLQERNVECSEEDIRRAYRSVSIVCHPDKSRPERREVAEERFKGLQVGFEVLTDPPRRRAYDSSLPFDDSLPKDREGTTERTFFGVYDPVFRRNERFSQVKPCPSLGDTSTSDAQVLEFYDFWYSFKSWRDFSALNEHRLEEAHSREEKRMFIRENEKKQASAKKGELARVRKLTDDAYRKDPRIARIKAREEDEKKKKKNAKANQAKQREEEEKIRKAEQESKAKADAEAAAAAAAIEREQKKALKSARSYFGKYCREASIPDDQIEMLKNKLSMEEYNIINSLFKRDPHSPEAKTLILNLSTTVQSDEQEAKQATSEAKDRAAYDAKKAEEASAAADRLPWTFVEDQQLVKAIQRFPGGVQDRWAKITEATNALSGRQRSSKGVIRREKELESQLGRISVNVDQAYQKYLDTLKGEQHASELQKAKNMTREEVLKFLADKDEHEKALHVAAAEEERKQKLLDAAEIAIEASLVDEEMKVKEKQRQDAERLKGQKKKKEEIEKQAKQRAKSSSSSLSSEAVNMLNGAGQVPLTSTNAFANTKTESIEWTADEQASLEQALKTVSKDASDRWHQIAALVGTKSKQQCVKRFKEIREQVLKDVSGNTET